MKIDNKYLGKINDEQTIPLTEQDIKAYLDECIRFWRRKRDEENCEIAIYYVDAFQSVRVSLFGELYPIEKIKNEKLGG